MSINPIGLNASFGQNNNKKKTNMLIPASITGAVGGGLYSYQTKIILDNDNFLNSIDIIDKQMAKTLTLQKRFDYLKKLIQPFTDKLKSLGITPDATHISVEEMLKNYVHNPDNKGLSGLENDIRWAKGEVIAEDLDTPKQLLKIKEVQEKEFIKSLAENAQNGKVKISDIKRYFAKKITENTIITTEIKDFFNLIKKWNNKRIALFSGIGLVLGAFISKIIK